jgi:hypothetical protein
MGGMSDVSNMRRNKHDLGYNIIVLEIDHTRKLCPTNMEREAVYQFLDI